MKALDKKGRVKKGIANLEQFVAENEADIGGAFVVRTRSGGKHLYFRNP